MLSLVQVMMDEEPAPDELFMITYRENFVGEKWRKFS